MIDFEQEKPQGNLKEGLLILNDLGKISYVDAAAALIFGVKAQEMLNADFAGFLEEKSRPLLGEFLKGASGVIELTGLQKDAGTFPLVLAFHRAKRNNNILTALVRDKREKGTLDERLIEAVEMKSQFISMVSHELRTPLAAIKESLDLLSESCQEKFSQQELKIIGIAKKSVDRLARFSQEVLDFSKLGSGRLPLNKQKTRLDELLRHAFEITEPLARKHALHFLLNLAQDLPEVSVDQDKISQVVLNLLSNAIKFTPMGGKIVLSAYRSDSKSVIVCVEDNGVGIPKQQQHLVFEPFIRIDLPANKMPGAGLGLSIAKRLIELHGGQMRFESAGRNKGSKFSFDLPRD